jgi:hypothetical protein
MYGKSNAPYFIDSRGGGTRLFNHRICTCPKETTDDGFFGLTAGPETSGPRKGDTHRECIDDSFRRGELCGTV